MLGFAHLSPLFGGNRQLLGFRMSVLNGREKSERFSALTEKELAVCGSHYCEITYEGKLIQPPWMFPE